MIVVHRNFSLRGRLLMTHIALLYIHYHALVWVLNGTITQYLCVGPTPISVCFSFKFDLFTF